MKKEKIIAAVMVCAMIAASAGCGGNNTASTTTTAAETTTTTAAETTTTTAAETTAKAETTEAETTADESPMEMTAALFGRGVWEAYAGDILDSYFVFLDENTGIVIGAERIEEARFTCEQNGAEVMFHLGSDENNTPAVFDTATMTGTFTFGEFEVVYRFAALDTDVNDFLASHGYRTDADEPSGAAQADAGAQLFSRGVWEFYSGDILDCYYVFLDDKTGIVIGAERIEDVRFTCEQNGTEVMFHLGSEDNNTPAVFDTAASTGTFTFGEFEVVYRYAPLATDVSDFLAAHGFME